MMVPSPASPAYSSPTSSPSSPPAPSDNDSQYTAPLTPTPEPSPTDSPHPGHRRTSNAWSVFADRAEGARTRHSGYGSDGSNGADRDSGGGSRISRGSERSYGSESSQGDTSDDVQGSNLSSRTDEGGRRVRKRVYESSTGSETSYDSAGSEWAERIKSGNTHRTPLSAWSVGSPRSATSNEAAWNRFARSRGHPHPAKRDGQFEWSGSERDTDQSDAGDHRNSSRRRRKQRSEHSLSSASDGTRAPSLSSSGSAQHWAGERGMDDSDYTDYTAYSDASPTGSFVDKRKERKARQKSRRSSTDSEQGSGCEPDASKNEKAISPTPHRRIRPSTQMVDNFKVEKAPRSYGKSRIEVLQDVASSPQEVERPAIVALPVAPTSQKPLLRGDLSGPHTTTTAPILSVPSTQKSSLLLEGDQTRPEPAKAVQYGPSDFVAVDINKDGLADADSGRIVLDAALHDLADADRLKGQLDVPPGRVMDGAVAEVDPASIPLPRGSVDSGVQLQEGEGGSSVDDTGEEGRHERDIGERRKEQHKPREEKDRKAVVGDTKEKSLASRDARDHFDSEPTAAPDAKKRDKSKRRHDVPIDAANPHDKGRDAKMVVRAPRTQPSAAHRAARIAVLATATLILAIPLSLQIYLTSLLLAPIFGPPPAPSPTSLSPLDKVHLALAALCSVIIWNATRARGIKQSISVRVCLCMIALSADLVATSGRRLAGVLAEVCMAGTVSLSSAIWEGGMKGLGTGVMGWVLRGVSVERAGLAGMGMLSVGGLVGGSAFAAVCYDHIHVSRLTDEWPAHALRSTIFTVQVVAVHKALQWGLAGSTSILVQRPEQSILLISLLLTILALTLSEPPTPTKASFARTLHRSISSHFSLLPQASRIVWHLCSRLPQGTFPLFLLLRLPIIVIALRQQVFLRPSPPFTMGDTSGVRILSSERGQTGLIVVGESVRNRVRWVRRDDGLVGGRWARNVAGVVTLGDTVTVPLVETALLVDKPSAADSIARTISLTTDLQFPDDDDDSLSADRRALVIGIGAGTALSTLHTQGYSIDAVEPEPLLYRVAIDHFNVTAPESINLLDGWAFVQSVSALREEEKRVRAERVARRAKERAAAAGEGEVRDMLVGMSLARSPKVEKKKGWWGHEENEDRDEDEDEDEDDDEGEDMGAEGGGGSAKWGMVWIEGRSVELLADPRTAISARVGDVDVFWREVRMMLLDDGILALDTSGVLRLKETVAALLVAFEQCRGFADARYSETLPHTALTNPNATLAPAVIICTPSPLPLTFRRPLPSDVRRSPIRAMMYDAFLKHEVALDAYISGLGGGSRVNGTNAGTPGDFGSSVDVGEEVGGGRWRDRRQVDLMRAVLTPSQWTIF